MSGIDLSPAVTTVVERCLAVGPGEEAVVVVDEPTRALGEELRRAVARAGADSILAVMEPRAIDGAEPPGPIAGALERCRVFIAATSRSLSHTRARKAATDAGARGATMPGVTEELLARVMAVDLELVAARSQAVARLLSSGRRARVRCPRGSDLELDLGGRQGVADDGDLRSPGAFGNLPCGEGFVAPLGGEGRVVATSLAGLGISDPPVTLSVRDGLLMGAEDGLGPRFYELLAAHGEAGRNLAELGVGTNEAATLTGNVLEDEKLLGSVHIAFGASAGIGGSVSVPIHLDAVVLDASLEVDGTVVLEGGRFVLDL